MAHRGAWRCRLPMDHRAAPLCSTCDTIHRTHADARSIECARQHSCLDTQRGTRSHALSLALAINMKSTIYLNHDTAMWRYCSLSLSGYELCYRSTFPSSRSFIQSIDRASSEIDSLCAWLVYHIW